MESAQLKLRDTIKEESLNVVFEINLYLYVEFEYT